MQIYHASVTDTWKTTGSLFDVPGAQIVAAIVPALIITVLFFFDHNVSAQLAQTEDFGLEKPPAYHYDFLLQGLNTLLLGLLGLPPTNGVLPQAPMHTRSLMGVGQDRNDPNKKNKVLEQRMSNLIQSALIALTLFLSPVIKLLPRAVLWGYFLFMAIESFPGNQFIHRITLFVVDLSSYKGTALGVSKSRLPVCPYKTDTFLLQQSRRDATHVRGSQNRPDKRHALVHRDAARRARRGVRGDVGGCVRDRVSVANHGPGAVAHVRFSEAVPRVEFKALGRGGGRGGSD